MDDIAIYFQKFDLNNGKYIFKPVDVITGRYDPVDDFFISVAGIYYEPIFKGSVDAEELFGYPTTLEKLRKKYGNNLKKDIILSEYVKENFDYIYFGYYDLEINGLSFIRVPFDKIENFDEELKKSLAIKYENIDLMSEIPESKFTFPKSFLIDLRNSLSLESVRDKIDEILDIENCLVNEKDIKNTSPKKAQNKIISLKELREEVLAKIIGQDVAVDDITRAVMINQTSKNPKNKSHILVTGPTGTGKTEIVKTICETLDLPYFEADATAYTKEGYVGKSVYSMLNGLLSAADNNIERAQNGILVIDEIDKKIYGGNNDSEFSKDMLYCLLKIMDRGNIELKDGSYFDTSNLTIILMGAFERTYQAKLKENNNTIGFKEIKPTLEKRKIILTKDDIIKDGMPSEFIGRIGDITATVAFTTEDLINILNKSKISALKLQREYFKDAFGVKLINTKDYVEEVAKQAIKSKTNARELKPIVRESLKYATDEFLMGKTAKTLKITRETVLNPKNYFIK